MSTRGVSFVQNEYYHIYNRGNSKQKVFLVPQDYERFVKLLFLSNSIHSFNVRDLGAQNVFDVDRERQLVNILAYCLMPNHFHILLTPLEDDGISKFMLKLSTAYSMYFNKKNNRTGTLFEGPYKSEFVCDDRYFRYLFAYIHLNPVKLIDKNWKIDGVKNEQKTIDYLFSYKYSSLSDYIGASEIMRKESTVIDKDLFGEIFNKKQVVLKELTDWFSDFPRGTLGKSGGVQDMI
ncbi:transposase [Candidatus Kaiserbacteria bacterium]|nr:MAG: transposase [Candidatus Kaiserbacteria bacterium]